MKLRTVLTGAVVAATATASFALAAPAQAHETPKAGSTCKVSGTVEIDHGKVYVCTTRKAGAKPTWGKGITYSRSPITVSDGWAKAVDRGMSAAFGVITNPTNKPIRVIAATSSYSTVVQLHEVVPKDGAMIMQQRLGGFVIPAKGTVELKPGGNHLMFMKVTKPITAGTMVPITLITSDGGLMRTRVLGKVFAGANEEYSAGSTGMSGM